MSETTFIPEQLEEVIKKKVNTEVKKSVIDIYDDLIKTIWYKITPTLGTVTVITIMQKAISKVSVKHPLFREINISENGVSFEKVRRKMESRDKEELKNSFKELVVNLFEILTKLTGNILINQLMKEVESSEFS